MKTALATDEPDEPDKGGYLPPRFSVVTNTTGATEAITVASTFDPIRQAVSHPPTTTATWPIKLQGAQPWQCPDCKLWMSPAVATHRCA